ncbi:hypothetical protein [Pontixanthobacter luteolus]|uniref:hypothetical protein n=1 Tax=Pontixanthobacter luteolus TaxID=295089 RepID=UPI002302F880|nr:hypothetical protein [Pontixanthobacter luteolus]
MKNVRKIALLALLAFAVPLHAHARENAAALSPSEQLELISSWEGRWQVAETPALEIVFE